MKAEEEKEAIRSLLRLVFTTLHTHGFFSSLEGHSDCEEMMRVLLLSLLKCDVLTEELWLTG